MAGSSLKNRGAKASKGRSAADSGSDSDNSDNESEKVKKEGEASKKSQPEGYNWCAMFVLLLFVSVPLFTAIQYVHDMYNPEAANERRIYDNVYKCYNAVGDVDKINSIDKFILKYNGKERSLYSQLRAKYGQEFPECDSFRQ